MGDTSTLQIGICGTFDVQGYGDLLFPIIAEAELSRRLGPIGLHRFSYSAKGPPDWPFTVTSLTELPSLVGSLDGMIIGGGHIIRFDKNVAPGYYPAAPQIHHPTGYWLTPALLALHRGCVVVWNAPGTFGDVPEWAGPLMQLALQLSSYVAVRDEASRNTLIPYVGKRDIAVVPDSAFGVARLLDTQGPSSGFSTLRQKLNLARPYIIVQATPGLGAFSRLVCNHPDSFADYQFVSLQVSAGLGDSHAALRGKFRDLVRVPDWSDPLIIAELIGGAAGVIGASLHLAITALAFGVPVFRPSGESAGKYAVLSGCSSVYSLADDEEIDSDWFMERITRRDPWPGLTGIFEVLDRHWDSIASCLSFSRTSRPGRERSAAVWQMLPSALEAAHGAQMRDQRATMDLFAEQITKLQAAIAERDRQLAALASAVRDRDDMIFALRHSTSWRVTSPLRWLGRKLRRSGTPEIIRLAKIERHVMSKVSYDWAFVNELFAEEDAEALVSTYPCDHFKTPDRRLRACL